jgi:hypothetical protein
MAGFIKNYTEAQDKEAIITPTTGKKLVVWKMIVETANEKGATVEFQTSDKKLIDFSSAGKRVFYGQTVYVGAEDEDLTLTCGANTNVIIQYDEFEEIVEE